MIINPQIPLHRLVLSMADAMDCVHKEISNHQLRVAYLSTNIARRMGYRGQALLDVFVAAAFHDIGLVRSDKRMQAVYYGKLEGLSWHGEVGYLLLRDQALFADAAKLIRYHHTHWENGRGEQQDGLPVPLGSHMIHLADEVDRAIDRDIPILRQQGRILTYVTSLEGKQLHPSCVEAFCSLAGAESFWLDCVSDRIYGVLLKQVDWPTLTLDETVVKPVAEMFGRLVDAGSQWTATHSAGVTATAVALSERLEFSPREQALMRAAGYLHDLGKLTIPSRILDKPDRLTRDEMLCMKQHTYHTFRILDTIGGMPQIAEWAAFHHERLDGNGYGMHVI
jgi:putative nucleotidyltransferase with HDIG domain